MKKEMLISTLVENGWFHQQEFLDASFCSELLDEAKSCDWKQAHIGRGNQKHQAEHIRNDSIHWLDEKSSTPNQQSFFNIMNELMIDLNRELFLGLKEYECHFAHYKTSGFYKKHLDQLQNSNARTISTIFYLNTPDAGGELVIYNKNNPELVDIKIQPKPGSFVCFLSNQIYHEVLPTKGERYSLTGWFRNTIS